MIKRRAKSTVATFLAIAAMTVSFSAYAGELTVTDTKTRENAVVYTLDDLTAMPETEFATSTIWTEGVNTFAGVSLHDFLEIAKLEGDTLHVIALNDYAVEVPVTDAVAGGPIIAYEMDGKTMSVREKGPYWLVYPFDSSADYRSETIYSRSIWQIDRIEVR